MLEAGELGQHTKEDAVLPRSNVWRLCLEDPLHIRGPDDVLSVRRGWGIHWHKPIELGGVNVYLVAVLGWEVPIRLLLCEAWLHLLLAQRPLAGLLAELEEVSLVGFLLRPDLTGSLLLVLLP